MKIIFIMLIGVLMSCDIITPEASSRTATPHVNNIVITPSFAITLNGKVKSATIVYLQSNGTYRTREVSIPCVIMQGTYKQNTYYVSAPGLHIQISKKSTFIASGKDLLQGDL